MLLKIFPASSNSPIKQFRTGFLCLKITGMLMKTGPVQGAYGGYFAAWSATRYTERFAVPNQRYAGSAFSDTGAIQKIKTAR